jgi:hypothetical protein
MARSSFEKLLHQVNASFLRYEVKNLQALDPVPNATVSMYCYITNKKLLSSECFPEKVNGFSTFTSLGINEG